MNKDCSCFQYGICQQHDEQVELFEESPNDNDLVFKKNIQQHLDRF